MAKLKEGQKVKQEFLVTLKFTAQDGDTKFKANEIVENLGLVTDMGQEVSIRAKELKQEIPA